MARTARNRVKELLHPDFTGIWTVNLEKSVLLVAIPRQILVKIEHREPALVQQVFVVSADGQEQRQTFTIGVGAETRNAVSGMPVRCHARWDGQELIIESWMTTPKRVVSFKDCWSLSSDGALLTMAHRDDDLAGQITLLERGTAANLSMFDV